MQSPQARFGRLTPVWQAEGVRRASVRLRRVNAAKEKSLQ